MTIINLIKKITAFSLVSFVIVLTTLPNLAQPVQAAQSLNFTYELIDNGTNVSITGYIGTETEVVIPSIIEGKNVTTIGDSTLSDCTALQQITIPISVMTIGENVFEECNSLNAINVDLNNSNYSSFEGVLFNKDKSIIIRYPIDKSGTSFNIPSSVQTINNNAFFYCTNLNSMIIPNSVVRIGNRAFKDCTAIQQITIPDSVITIGDNVFEGCRSLKSIYIPKSVQSIGTAAFVGCFDLTSLVVDENNEYYCSSEDVLYDKNKTTIILCPIYKSNSDFIIPETVTSIAPSSFNCSNLSKILIPNCVTSIGDNAFGGSGLKEITLPSNLVTIGEYAFVACGFKTITIPKNVTKIGYGAFFACYDINSFNIDIDNINYTSSDGVLFDKQKTILIQYPPGKELDEYIVPNSVSTIDDEAFSISNLSKILIPKNVKSISDNAFEMCRNLSEIDIDVNNTNYSSSAGVLFNKEKTILIKYPIGNASNKYIIPNSVTSINDRAFSYCNNLTTVVLSNSLTSIGESVFKGCINIASMIIPNGVTSIGSFAFGFCFSLSSVTIPNTVKEISQHAFIDCNNLIIYGYKGSYAEQYAKDNRITFKEFLSDISEITWAKDAIISLAESNVISGYEDGSFRPQNSITRAEFTKMLTVSFGIYDSAATSKFKDVTDGQWYASYVGSAENEGITEGIGDGYFSPESTISRQEMFTFCARAIVKYKGYEMVTDNAEINQLLGQFIDSKNVNDWAKGTVATCIKYGLITGTPVEGGLAINAKNSITRAEVAVVLDRAIKLQNKTK